MAQTGYTPIQLYYSATTTNAPSAGNLSAGELAINTTDGKLFYKDSSNAVQVIAWKNVPLSTVTGTLAVANGGTGITSFGTGVATWLGTPSSANLAAAATDETGSGALVFGTAPTISSPTISDGYTEEVYSFNTGTAATIDLANGSVQIPTLTGNCTYTFPTATAGQSFMLLQKQDATGSRTVTWPASVKWPASTAPTITSTASKGDKFVFTADGTYWWGSVAGQNYL